MHRRTSWRGAGLALLFTPLSGCYSDDDPKPLPSQLPCGNYAAFVPVGQPSFAEDVLPLFQSHCTASECHGGVPSEAKASLWLGPPPDQTATDAERQLVIDQLVLTRTVTAPDVGTVLPGQPARSFLMLKIDGCHDDPAFSCEPQPGAVSDAPCGDSMPQGERLLPGSQRRIVRSWIALGAKDN